MLTLVQEGVFERAAGNPGDLDGVEVAALLQPEHGVDRHLGEVVLVLRQNLGAERGARDVHQVLPEGRFVAAVVLCARVQGLPAMDVSTLAPNVTVSTCRNSNTKVVTFGLMPGFG